MIHFGRDLLCCASNLQDGALLSRFLVLLVTLFALSSFTSLASPPKNHMRAYIIHGYGASPTDHWFSWLDGELRKRGAVVSIASLPNPYDPQPAEWQRALEQQVKSVDKDTYFIAHSLGSIALLDFLKEVRIEGQIGGYVLVSGFNASLPMLPQLDGFQQPDLDYEKLARVARTRIVIAALDDAIVPFPITQALASSLDAELISIEHGGHFLASDGFSQFPLLLNELEEATSDTSVTNGR